MTISLLVVCTILSDRNCFELNIVDQHRDNKLSILYSMLYSTCVCNSLLACILNYNLMSSADQCESCGNSPAAKKTSITDVTHYVSSVYIVYFRFTYMDASGASCGKIDHDSHSIVIPG